MNIISSTSLRFVAIFAAVAAATVGLYWPALHGYFLSDDLGYLYSFHDWEQKGVLWTEVFARFGEGMPSQGNFYRPIGLVTYAINFSLHGDYALAWHLSSFFLHVLNAWLVWRFARTLTTRFLGRNENWFALLAAVLFLIHSPAEEVTVWIAGRHDALAVAFSLLCLERAARGTSPRHIAWVMIWLALALMCKESALTLPPTLWLLWLLTIGGEAGGWRWMVWPVLGTSAVLLAYLALRWELFGSILAVYRDRPVLPS